MSSRSNIQRFLRSVTPSVPSKSIPRSSVQGLNKLWFPGTKETVEYFELSDLWDALKEWSAYGVGTPIALGDEIDNVTQYFAPYLSGIQIYADKSALSTRKPEERNGVEGSVEGETDSCTDGSENDKLSRSSSNSSSKKWEVDSTTTKHDSSSQMMDRFGSLCFEQYDSSSPYWRTPLVDRVAELAVNFHGLMTLKSIDLSPASWIAIAWYPIYYIPNERHLENFGTCFLTFHTLSSSFHDSVVQESTPEQKAANDQMPKSKTSSISLPPFGLASYRLNKGIWVNEKLADGERMLNLHTAAHSWLKQLSVQLHDFSFFTKNSLTTGGIANPAAASVASSSSWSS